MITESGIVTNANLKTALIKTVRAGACESCSSRKSCGTAHSHNEITVAVKNTIGVKEGDHVVIGLETRPMLYLTFLLYVFPILLMIIGAVFGNYMAPTFNFNPSVASMICGFSCFGFAFYIIRQKHKTLSQKDEFKPFLIRKKPAPIQGACTPS